MSGATDRQDRDTSEARQLRALLRLFALFTLGMTREVERDMRRVLTLSDEAIGEVSNNFLQVGKLTTQLRDALRQEPGEEHARMERALLLAELKTETDTAIRNLQHQDIISQVLTASGRQVTRLEDTAQRIYEAAAGDASLDPALLETLQSQLEELIASIRSGEAHPVAQSSMQAGSVDLF